MRYLVSYDIACNRRRRHVAQALDGFGERIQESVYELELREPQWQQLARRLDRLIDPVQDQWRGWRLCMADRADMVELGLASPAPLEGALVV